jgi:Acyl-CoA dehydrogenase, C-terminal domain
MDADTRELLAGSVRALLQSQPAELPAGLAELGWDEVVSDHAAAAIELLFTEQGRAGVASAALDGVLIAACGDLPPSEASQLLVVHPFGSVASSVGSGRLRVDGVVLAKPSAVGCYVVAGDNCPTAYAVPTTKVAPPTPVAGFDPSSSLSRVRFDVAIDDTREHERGWELATAAARRALACELIGNGCAMLDIAVEHVAQRHQFGRPIGANQTPRHRLADAYVQLSAAHELVRIAYVSDRPWDATVAKTYAGYAVDTTSRACLQVCGAMGLTSEHPLGGYVKRFRTLDALYGRWQQTMRAVGEQLLEARVIPRGVGV